MFTIVSRFFLIDVSQTCDVFCVAFFWVFFSIITILRIAERIDGHTKHRRKSFYWSSETLADDRRLNQRTPCATKLIINYVWCVEDYLCWLTIFDESALLVVVTSFQLVRLFRRQIFESPQIAQLLIDKILDKVSVSFDLDPKFCKQEISCNRNIIFCMLSSRNGRQHPTAMRMMSRTFHFFDTQNNSTQ